MPIYVVFKHCGGLCTTVYMRAQYTGKIGPKRNHI